MKQGVSKIRRMKRIEICFIILFAAVLVGSIISGAIWNVPQVSLVLLMIDFPIAVIIAFFGSLSIREEEEEKEKS